MKQVKRLFCLALCLVLALSVTACGGEEEESGGGAASGEPGEVNV